VGFRATPFPSYGGSRSLQDLSARFSGSVSFGLLLREFQALGLTTSASLKLDRAKAFINGLRAL
jgi:hypothetical protein